MVQGVGEGTGEEQPEARGDTPEADTRRLSEGAHASEPSADRIAAGLLRAGRSRAPSAAALRSNAR